MVFEPHNTQNSDDSHAQRLQLIGSMASFISHDFNNILTVILGYCDVALSSENIDEKTDCIKQIQESTKRAARLTAGLLNLSRQGSKPELLNSQLLFQDLEPTIQRLISNIGGVVRFELDDNLWNAQVDLVWLEQAILNLVLNAVQASDKGKEVVLRAYNRQISNPKEFCSGYMSAPGMPDMQSGEYLLIEVQDHGSGIPEQLKLQIFSPFFTTKSGNNTGIGLANVSTIIKQSGGQIYIKSKMGEGTTFMILLPRARQQEMASVLQDPMLRAQEQMQAKIKDGSKNLGKGQLVLLVEDEELLRRVAKMGLLDHGYRVVDFTTAEEGLEYLQNLQPHSQAIPDILVSDVSLPHMDGYTLASEVKSLHPNMMLLLLSGVQIDPAAAANWLRQTFGELPYMVKPFTIPQLVLKVREVLDDKTV